MTNFEYIKSLNEEELADYIFSVYLTGVWSAKHGINKEDMKKVSLWLKQEKVNSNNEK